MVYYELIRFIIQYSSEKRVGDSRDETFNTSRGVVTHCVAPGNGDRRSRCSHLVCSKRSKGEGAVPLY